MPNTGITGKIARKYMAHFLDSTFGGTTPSWYRVGKDLEEFNVEMNPDTEKKKNILGNNSFIHNGYEMSASAEPFYAEVGDALFERLQQIVDSQINDDTLKTKSLEVHLWDEGTTSGTYKAYRQDCYVVPTSYGGDTSGYQIPFEVTYVGEKVSGIYTPGTGGASGTFTPDT